MSMKLGFIAVDKQQRTNVPHIFAIGDIAGNPMLAHKASHEGKVAAEVAAGHKAGFDALTIPAVAYTDPEVAWMGLTENQAKQQGIDYDKAVFPWAASGRSLSLGTQGRLDQNTLRKGNRQNTRRRHGRPQCGRINCRSGTGSGNGRGCRRHRFDYPPTSLVIRDFRVRRRNDHRLDYRSLYKKIK